MNKDETIEFLKLDHEKLEKVINSLTENQMVNTFISKENTIKDILAHISAWNIALHIGIDDLLNNRRPEFFDLSEDEFNKLEMNKRRSWSLNKIIKEWNESIQDLLEKIRSLPETKWNSSTNFNWPSGGSVTIASLFGYRYRGEGHEGGHAKQITEYFNCFK